MLYPLSYGRLAEWPRQGYKTVPPPSESGDHPPDPAPEHPHLAPAGIPAQSSITAAATGTVDATEDSRGFGHAQGNRA